MNGQGWDLLRQGQRIALTDIQIGVGEKHSVGQEVSKSRVRPTVYDKARDEVKIGTRIHIVRNTRCNHR